MNLNGGGFEGLSSFPAGDDAGGSEYRGEEDEAWESTKAKEEKFSNTVNQCEYNSEYGEFGIFDLVVAETEEAKLPVVFGDRSAEGDYADVVFVVGISSYQAPVQFNHHGEGKFLVRGLVQSPRSLDNLEARQYPGYGIVVYRNPP